MAYLGTYNDRKYEVTQYTSGGSIRDRLTNEIVAEYSNYWTPDGSPHQDAVESIKLIESELGIRIQL